MASGCMTCRGATNGVVVVDEDEAVARPSEGPRKLFRWRLGVASDLSTPAEAGGCVTVGAGEPDMLPIVGSAVKSPPAVVDGPPYVADTSIDGGGACRPGRLVMVRCVKDCEPREELEGRWSWPRWR